MTCITIEVFIFRFIPFWPSAAPNVQQRLTALVNGFSTHLRYVKDLLLPLKLIVPPVARNTQQRLTALIKVLRTSFPVGKQCIIFVQMGFTYMSGCSRFYSCLVASAFWVIEPQTRSTVSTDFIVILAPRPRLRPSQAKAEPSMTALARPVDSESQSRWKPGQSRGFQAKPGRHITTCEMDRRRTGWGNAHLFKSKCSWKHLLYFIIWDWRECDRVWHW